MWKGFFKVLYRASKEETNHRKKIVLKEIRKKVFLSGIFRPLGERTLYEITVDGNIIGMVSTIFNFRLPLCSADRANTFIEIPKQLTWLDKAEYPGFARSLLTDADNSITRAWLNLGGKRKYLGYFGINAIGTRGGSPKEFLQVLSGELGVPIRDL